MNALQWRETFRMHFNHSWWVLGLSTALYCFFLYTGFSNDDWAAPLTILLLVIGTFSARMQSLNTFSHGFILPAYRRITIQVTLMMMLILGWLPYFLITAGPGFIPLVSAPFILTGFMLLGGIASQFLLGVGVFSTMLMVMGISLAGGSPSWDPPLVLSLALVVLGAFMIVVYYRCGVEGLPYERANRNLWTMSQTRQFSEYQGMPEVVFEIPGLIEWVARRYRQQPSYFNRFLLLYVGNQEHLKNLQMIAVFALLAGGLSLLATISDFSNILPLMIIGVGSIFSIIRGEFELNLGKPLSSIWVQSGCDDKNELRKLTTQVSLAGVAVDVILVMILCFAIAVAMDRVGVFFIAYSMVIPAVFCSIGLNMLLIRVPLRVVVCFVLVVAIAGLSLYAGMATDNVAVAQWVLLVAAIIIFPASFVTWYKRFYEVRGYSLSRFA